jgi:hypothetical protein
MQMRREGTLRVSSPIFGSRPPFVPCWLTECHTLTATERITKYFMLFEVGARCTHNARPSRRYMYVFRGRKRASKFGRVQKLLLCQKKFRRSAKEKLHTGIMLLKPFLLCSAPAAGAFLLRGKWRNDSGILRELCLKTTNATFLFFFRLLFAFCLAGKRK